MHLGKLATLLQLKVRLYLCHLFTARRFQFTSRNVTTFARRLDKGFIKVSFCAKLFLFNAQNRWKYYNSLAQFYMDQELFANS